MEQRHTGCLNTIGSSFTGVTLTVATVFAAEPGTDGERMTSGGSVNGLDNEPNLEGSRWNEGEIGTGTTAGTRRVLQSSLDSGTMVAVETAFSCNRMIGT